MTNANNKILAAAQSGDQIAREKLIQDYKPYIYKVATEKCGRSLDWHNDDELSIALLAFNSAIDSYNPDANPNFASFAALVIRHRLIDYFRQEEKHRHLLLSQISPQGAYLPGEEAAAQQCHQAKELQESRQDELLLFTKLLGNFGITLEELTQSSPKHRDTKENLASIATSLANNRQVLNKLISTGLLPIKELMELTGASRKVLEKGRRYIIALTLILTHELHHLRAFVQLPAPKEVHHRDQ